MALAGLPPFLIADSGVVAAGGAIDTGVKSTQGCSRLAVYFLNSDAATRTVVRTDFMFDGTTSLGAVFSVAAAASVTSVGDHGPGAVNLSTKVTLGYSAPVPPNVQFTIAAAGSSNGRIVVYGYP